MHDIIQLLKKNFMQTISIFFDDEYSLYTFRYEYLFCFQTLDTNIYNTSIDRQTDRQIYLFDQIEKYNDRYILKAGQETFTKAKILPLAQRPPLHMIFYRNNGKA